MTKKITQKEKQMYSRIDLTMMATNIAWWEMELPSGKVAFHRRKTDMLGYEPDGFKHYEDFTNLLHPDDHDKAMQAMRDHLEGKKEKYETEYRIRTKSGEYKWFRDIGSVVEKTKDGSEIKVAGIVINISEQRLAEIEKNIVNDYLKSVIDSIPHPFYTIDPNTYEITMANKALGESVIGRKCYEITHNTKKPCKGKDHPCIIDVILQTKKPFTVEHTHYDEDKNPIFVEVTGYPLFDNNNNIGQIIEHSIDITDKKKMKDALVDSEQLMAGAQKIANLGSWELDLINNTLSWSDQVYRIFGIRPQEIKPNYKDFLGFVHPDDREKVDNAYKESLTENRSEYEVEHRIIRKDNGEIRYVLEKCEHIKNKSGKIIRSIGMIHDITERKTAEEKLKEANEELMQSNEELRQTNEELYTATNYANKMAENAEIANKAKSEFLANMSHEIRTPLNGVIGFTELLMNTKLTATQKTYIEKAHASAGLLMDVINDILDFSKIEAGKLELDEVKTDIIDLIETTSDVVKHSVDKKDVELLLNIHNNVPRFLYVDPVRIRQVLVNLLGNAVKFTEKGEIEISVEYKAGRDEGKLGEFLFSVRDTGIGISPEQQKRLFKAFSQADTSTTRKYGGTGLGLVISYRILEKMNSELKLDSIRREGSTFHFTIRREYERGNSLPAEKIKNINKALIIDDNENHRYILKDMLMLWKIESEMAAGLNDAIEKINNNNHYDVILVDCIINDINGTDAIKELRKFYDKGKNKIPEILLCKSDDTQLFEETKKLNIDYTLVKPVKAKELYNSLISLYGSQTKGGNEETTVSIQKAAIKLTKKDPVILIVEDTEMIMYLVKTLITQIIPGATIVEATNGEEGVSKYKRIKPDMVLLDLQMPVKDGYAVVREIRQFESDNNLYGKPVIALTARAVTGEKEKCLEAGMDDFLPKPLEYDDLVDTLEKHLASAIGNDIVQSGEFVDNESKKQAGRFDREGLLKRLGESKSEYNELLGMAMTQIPEYIKKLSNAISEKDFNLIKQAAHKLKGAALFVSFNQLGKLAEKMEYNEEQNVDLFKKILKEIEREFEEVREEVGAER